MDSLTMREERAKLVIEARKVIDQAEAEGNRPLTGEENQKWERLMGEVDSLAEKISTSEKREATSKAEAELSKSYRKTSPTVHNTRKEGNRSEAMRSWFLRGANKGCSAEAIDNAAACGIDLSSRWMNVSLRSEQRALANGTLNIPDFGQGFDRALKAFGGAKNHVKNWQTANGVTVNVPTVDDTSNMATIVAEAGSIPITPDPTFSSVALGAFKYSTRAIQVSLELLQDSVIPLESLLTDLLAERLGRAVNNHITVGTGSGQPNGLCPRASTSSVVVGGTVASPTFSVDNLLDLIASVDPAYRGNSKFMMNDAIAFRFRKLKDSTGQYLWQPSVIAGQPDRLCGYEVFINQDMPALAVNARVVLFGDYGRYIWREVSDLQFYRLDELYAISGQVGFMGLYRADGNLINTSAVKFLSAPAS
jgi:HK97 family phage major capsid protein